MFLCLPLSLQHSKFHQIEFQSLRISHSKDVSATQLPIRLTSLSQFPPRPSSSNLLFTCSEVEGGCVPSLHTLSRPMLSLLPAGNRFPVVLASLTSLTSLQSPSVPRHHLHHTPRMVDGDLDPPKRLLRVCPFPDTTHQRKYRTYRFCEKSFRLVKECERAYKQVELAFKPRFRRFSKFPSMFSAFRSDYIQVKILLTNRNLVLST